MKKFKQYVRALTARALLGDLEARRTLGALVFALNHKEQRHA